MIELNQDEFFIVMKMLKLLNPETANITRHMLSSVLGFSTYSKTFYQKPLFKKLQYEEVFVENGSNSYNFNWKKLKEILVNSRTIGELEKATKMKFVRVI